MAWLVFYGGLAALLLATAWAVRMLNWALWQPRRLEHILRSQGLKGSTYRPITGDLMDISRLDEEAWSKPMPSFSHAILPRVTNFLSRTIETYGKENKVTFHWAGPHPRVLIGDPDLTREFLANKSGEIKKEDTNYMLRYFLRGVVQHDGEKWAKHRKILNPAFHIEKLKRMLPAFSDCCNELVDRWETMAATGKEVDIWVDLQSFTGDVISRTAFGSNFEEGRKIFQLIDQQALIVARALLGLLLESNLQHRQEQGNAGLTTDEVVEECKLFYFAGQETTSLLLTWTMVALSLDQDWQERARQEVLQVFGKEKPTFDRLSHLKTVTMILYEVLRLYPPALALVRQVVKSVKIGDVVYPPGVLLFASVIQMHHDPDYWGKDVDEFKPERFAEGVYKASAKNAYFPFGGGHRVCLGQNFSLLEAKLALCMILQRFSFELSPAYIHAPHLILTLKPQHGALIRLRNL